MVLTRPRTVRATITALGAVAPLVSNTRALGGSFHGFAGAVKDGKRAGVRLMPAFTSLTELVVNAADKYGDRPFFGTKRNGKFEFDSFKTVNAQVDVCRSGLKQPGWG